MTELTNENWVWQSPDSDKVVELYFREVDGRIYCNNGNCERCYPKPKPKNIKKRLRCEIGIHEFHRWYVSRFYYCRFCKTRKETY